MKSFDAMNLGERSKKTYLIREAVPKKGTASLNRIIYVKILLHQGIPQLLDKS